MRFFEPHVGLRIVPHAGEILGQLQESFAVDPLVLPAVAGLGGHPLPFDFGHHLQGPVPALFELAGYKTVLRLRVVVLPSRALCLEAGLLELERDDLTVPLPVRHGVLRGPDGSLQGTLAG